MTPLRWVWMAPLLAGLVACGGKSPCQDEDGEDLEVCSYGDGLEFCPGDQWEADDSCNSCGCGPTGEVVCTALAECGNVVTEPGTTPTGTTSGGT